MFVRNPWVMTVGNDTGTAQNGGSGVRLNEIVASLEPAKAGATINRQISNGKKTRWKSFMRGLLRLSERSKAARCSNGAPKEKSPQEEYASVAPLSSL